MVQSLHPQKKYMMVQSITSTNSFLKTSSPDLSHTISKVITEKENDHLIACPLKNELKEAIKSISIDSSPSPDSFDSGFYLPCWEIIKVDVLEATINFFRGTKLLGFSLPPILFSSQRQCSPLVLINFILLVYVLWCTKFSLRSFLLGFLDISTTLSHPMQGAFIVGKSIFENITLVQEMVHIQ